MFYAINKQTKEHRICRPELSDHMLQPAIMVNADERTVEADADGWIPWDGGECPLPDGAKCEIKDDKGRVYKDVETPHSVMWLPDGSTIKITAYRPILDAEREPEAPAWDGSGLPPVGAECEYFWQEGNEYRKGIVLVHHGDAAVIRDAEGWVFAGCFALQLRPIRSEEDKTVEDMADIMRGTSVQITGNQQAEIASALYRAGYRKEASDG